MSLGGDHIYYKSTLLPYYLENQKASNCKGAIFVSKILLYESTNELMELWFSKCSLR